MPSPADQRAEATEARRLEKARYAPEDLGKRARKDGVAKRRPQDEDKKHSEGETQKPDGVSRRARVGVRVFSACRNGMSMTDA
jgi:hypothetical protein